MKYNYETAESLSSIDLQKLYLDGKRYIIIDLDNTIARWHTQIIKEEALLWLETAKKMGFTICILSNSHDKRRPADAASLLGIMCCSAKHKKPSRHSYESALQCMGGQKHNAIMIGDQLFCDVLGAARAGIDGILVNPIYKREAKITKFMRLLEIINGRKIIWQDNKD